MAKKTYVTVVDGVEFTRTTDRKYTHMVVSGKLSKETLLATLGRRLTHARTQREQYQPFAEGRVKAPETLANHTAEDYAKWVADLDAEILWLEAKVEATKDETDGKRSKASVAHGWCSRLDLAQRLAAKAEKEGYLNVQVIEVPEPVKVAGAPVAARGMGIGKRCRELIAEGKSTKEILEIIHAEFPKAHTSASSVNWYRSQMRKMAAEVEIEPEEPTSHDEGLEEDDSASVP